jgi:hypothetical protein
MAGSVRWSWGSLERLYDSRELEKAYRLLHPGNAEQEVLRRANLFDLGTLVDLSPQVMSALHHELKAACAAKINGNPQVFQAKMRREVVHKVFSVRVDQAHKEGETASPDTSSSVDSKQWEGLSPTLAFSLKLLCSVGGALDISSLPIFDQIVTAVEPSIKELQVRGVKGSGELGVFSLFSDAAFKKLSRTVDISSRKLIAILLRLSAARGSVSDLLKLAEILLKHLDDVGLIAAEGIFHEMKALVANRATSHSGMITVVFLLKS